MECMEEDAIAKRTGLASDGLASDQIAYRRY